MKKRYEHLIFDADHTLLDYLADERSAFVALYNELEIPVDEELLALSRRLSESVWTQAGLYDVHREDIQKRYHELYRSHVTGIFEGVFAQYPCKEDPIFVGEKFLVYLERKGNLFPQTQSVLRALSKKTGGRYEISIATNGISPIQKGRLRDLEKYVKKSFISEELGCIKPLAGFFERMLAELQAQPSECLMIGDSLFSDIAGAKAVGMDCCWLNPSKKKNDTGICPDYEIENLSDLLPLLE